MPPKRPPLDRSARRLAARQHGAVAVRQLRRLGASATQIRNLTGDHDRWSRASDEVLVLNGTPDGPERRVSCAVLDAGDDASLAYASAGRWWGLTGCALEPVVVARTRATRRTDTLASVRRVRFLPEGWVTVHRGVRVARPELLALQLFAAHREERAERLLDRLWSMRLCSVASLRSFCAGVPLRGVRGSAALRRYLGERSDDLRPPESNVESRFRQIVRNAGIPFRTQVDLGDERSWTGRVDFLHEWAPLVVEVQSEAYHSSLVDRDHDRARIERLHAAGLTVVEVTDTMVWTAPDAVVRAVELGLERPGPSHRPHRTVLRK